MADIDLRALINPSERQDAAFQASLKAIFLLYGGAMGGGKSYFLRWWSIREAIRLHALYGVRDHRLGLFSKDYPTLRDRQISRIRHELPKSLGRAIDSNVDGFGILLKPQFGGGFVALRNLDQPEKYNSAEFAGIAVEELTELEEFVFTELRKRLRWPGIPQSDMHFVAAANPGGIGHAWVKKLWIDKIFPPEMLALAKDFDYIPAKASDNPHLDPDYRARNLDTLPEDMRKAYADGSWDIFAGQYFTEWRKDVHVVEPFAIPWYWKVWRCGDWGEEKPCAHLWIAADPEGNHYVIREVYGAGMRIEEQASRILKVENELKRHDTQFKAFAAEDDHGSGGIAEGVLDSACWDVTGRAESIAQQFANFGVRWAKASKGSGSRVAGWKRLAQMLHQEPGKSPKLRVFSNCMDTIRTIPTLIHDKIRPEDVDTDGEDHAGDALRYGTDSIQVLPSTPLATMHPDDAAFMAYAREAVQ